MCKTSLAFSKEKEQNDTQLSNEEKYQELIYIKMRSLLLCANENSSRRTNVIKHNSILFDKVCVQAYE